MVVWWHDGHDSSMHNMYAWTMCGQSRHNEQQLSRTYEQMTHSSSTARWTYYHIYTHSCPAVVVAVYVRLYACTHTQQQLYLWAPSIVIILHVYCYIRTRNVYHIVYYYRYTIYMYCICMDYTGMYCMILSIISIYSKYIYMCINKGKFYVYGWYMVSSLIIS